MCLSEEQLNKAAIKGHVKQKTWTEYIQSILKKPDISPSTETLLSKISKCVNIPRKKTKFVVSTVAINVRDFGSLVFCGGISKCIGIS